MSSANRKPPGRPQKSSSQQVRDWTGPGLLTYGYRPFFLGAGTWAALAMMIWLAELSGWLVLRSRFDPVDWHAHEMLFGYLGAVMAGYLLSATPNWTGRLPILGWPLAGLAALWGLGRIAVASSVSLAPGLTALIDLAFPVVLAAVLGREIIAGRAWRNLMLFIPLSVFITANGLFHLAAAQSGHAADTVGFRLGLAVGVMMITIVGGRIIPSFTRSWLVRQGAEYRPVPHRLTDLITVIATISGLAAWVVMPNGGISASLGLVAGLANLIRMGGWGGWHVRAEPLLWILHVGYFGVPLGFLAISATMLNTDIAMRIGAQHIWMAGAIGLTTLAVMTRVSLGHAKLPMRATRATTLVYLTVIAAVVLRIFAGFDESPTWVMHLSAAAWVTGFLGFAILYWPILNGLRS
jgi:uncharacterized protein involved in response to NO